MPRPQGYHKAGLPRKHGGQSNQNRRRAKGNKIVREREEEEKQRSQLHEVSPECLSALKEIDPYSLKPNSAPLVEFLNKYEYSQAKLQNDPNRACISSCPAARSQLLKIWFRVVTDCPLRTFKWLLTERKEKESWLKRLHLVLWNRDSNFRDLIHAIAQRNDLDRLTDLEVGELRMLILHSAQSFASFAESKEKAYLAAKVWDFDSTLCWPIQAFKHIVSQMFLYDPGRAESEIVNVVESALRLKPECIDQDFVPAMATTDLCKPRYWGEVRRNYFSKFALTVQERNAYLYTLRILLCAAHTLQMKELNDPIQTPEVPSYVNALDLNVYALEHGFAFPCITSLVPPDRLKVRVAEIRKSGPWTAVRTALTLHTRLLPPLVEIALEFVWPPTFQLHPTPTVEERLF